MTDLFAEKAPWIMALLMRDFGWTETDAAADLGNMGQECGGFRLLQEQHPLVAGSKGGYGWAQWTGPRREAYLHFCAANRLDPASDEANYKFHRAELAGSYAYVIGKVKNAGTLEQKVYAFERGYERAGIPNYPSRNAWARKALAAWAAAPKPVPLPAWAGGQANAPAAPPDHAPPAPPPAPTQQKPAEAPSPPAAPEPRPAPQPASAPAPAGVAAIFAAILRFVMQLLKGQRP